ncbi:hypothetical protein V6Z12_A05G207500 [Gossypium hirsutum]
MHYCSQLKHAHLIDCNCNCNEQGCGNFILMVKQFRGFYILVLPNPL